MAKVTCAPTVEVKISFTINESEARALDALAGYDYDAFLNIFYKHLGKGYLEPFEPALKEFMGTITGIARPALANVDRVRKELRNEQ